MSRDEDGVVELHKFICLGLTVFVAVLAFILNGSETDTIAVEQFFANSREQGVVEPRCSFDEVSCQRNLGRAESPNVQVVYPGNFGQACEIGSDCGRIDVLRHRIEREVQLISQKLPSAE